LTSLPAVAASELSPWRHQSVLVVDDEPGMVSFLQRSLESRCGWVAIAGSVEQAEELLNRRHFDLIVLDIALPGRSGVEWLHQLRDQGFAGDVVLMTAYADLETAIDALRAGAADFLLKPFSVAQMLNAVKRCFERSSLRRENFVLRRELDQRDDSVEGMVGDSMVIRDVCARIKRIAPTPSTVLIHGESGTGKELAARALHRMSPRSAGRDAGPFVPINCAAIAEEIIESELFGHVKGAFTGAASGREGLFYYARGGTLFLDEISELPPPVQAKLLRVLEERKVRPVGSEQEVPVDVRVVAATNRDLVAEVAAGRFPQRSLLPAASGRSANAAIARPARRPARSGGVLQRPAGGPPRPARAAARRGGAGAPGALPLAGQCARAEEPDRALTDPRLLRRRFFAR
jgi:DNA-binding NtrC family response regulator